MTSSGNKTTAEEGGPVWIRTEVHSQVASLTPIYKCRNISGCSRRSSQAYQCCFFLFLCSLQSLLNDGERALLFVCYIVGIYADLRYNYSIHSTKKTVDPHQTRRKRLASDQAGRQAGLAFELTIPRFKGRWDSFIS